MPLGLGKGATVPVPWVGHCRKLASSGLRRCREIWTLCQASPHLAGLLCRHRECCRYSTRARTYKHSRKALWGIRLTLQNGSLSLALHGTTPPASRWLQPTHSTRSRTRCRPSGCCGCRSARWTCCARWSRTTSRTRPPPPPPPPALQTPTASRALPSAGVAHHRRAARALTWSRPARRAAAEVVAARGRS